METIIFNDDNLLESQLDERTIKVRALIVNDNNEIILSKYAGLFLLPGGSVEDNENLYQALTREIKEETGIVLNIESVEPFLVVRQYNKNYPKRDNTFNNRLTETYYFVINTNQTIDLANISLMSDEVKDGFQTSVISLDGIEEIIKNNSTENPRDKYFTRELLAVLSAYKQTKSKNIKEIQNEIDEWANQFTEPYFPPLSRMAAMTEEVGEVARVINRMYGSKKGKEGENIKDLEEELGDLLFTLVCMANAENIDLDIAYERKMDKVLKRDSNRWERKDNK